MSPPREGTSARARDDAMGTNNADARRRLDARRRALLHTFETDPADPGPTTPAAAARELSDIQDALERIERGSYGACAVCGGALGRDFMRAVPEAALCTRCRGTAAR